MASIGKPSGKSRRRYVVNKEAVVVEENTNAESKQQTPVSGIVFLALVFTGLTVWLFAGDWRYFVIGALSGILAGMITEASASRGGQNDRT